LREKTGLKKDQIFGIEHSELERIGVIFRSAEEGLKKDREIKTQKLIKDRVPILKEAIQAIQQRQPNAEISASLIAKTMKESAADTVTGGALSSWFKKHK